jgi:4-hydroxy-3-methylbut-2-enyl diphosphate reductase
MNRSAVREFQAPGISLRRGELLVPTEVGDPARGPLRCPAGPLLAGSLLRKGLRAESAPLPQLDDPGSDAGGATVYLVTCPQRDGSTAALAVAVSPDDRLGAATASAAVAEWAAVAGTRRLLAAGSPWCSGARRARDIAGSTVAAEAGRGRVVHIYGNLAAPPEAGEELAARGAARTASLDGLAQGDIVIFPAHGVPPGIAAAAAERGLTVVDATCPLVTTAQEQAARLTQRGDDLVVIGQAGNAAAAGITAQAPGRVSVVETVAGTAALQVTDARRVSYLLEPGIEVESATPVAAALRSRFPAARAPHPDGFCYEPSDRAQTLRTIAGGCDLMLVLGEAGSADTRYLLGLARDCGARTQVIGAVGDLTPAMLGGVSAIGMAESTSAPSALAGQVVAALAGLGPLSVVRRQVTSEISTRAAQEAQPAAQEAQPAAQATQAGSDQPAANAVSPPTPAPAPGHAAPPAPLDAAAPRDPSDTPAPPDTTAPDTTPPATTPPDTTPPATTLPATTLPDMPALSGIPGESPTAPGRPAAPAS